MDRNYKCNNFYKWIRFEIYNFKVKDVGIVFVGVVCWENIFFFYLLFIVCIFIRVVFFKGSLGIRLIEFLEEDIRFLL